MFTCQFCSQTFFLNASMQAHIRRDRCAFRYSVTSLEQMRQQESIDVDMMEVDQTDDTAMEVSSSSENESASKVINNLV